MRDYFKKLLDISLTSFVVTQTTLLGDLSDEMKTYYSDYMIDAAVPLLVHDQWAQKHPIPKNGGKIIEFRKYSPLAKALTALTEGATPAGNSLSMSVINATIKQYGDFIELSDLLLLTAIDNNLVMASKLLGNQSGETLDTVSREVMNGGTNVQYGDADVASRFLLVGGESSGNHYLDVNTIRRAVRTMKKNKAKKINGDYVAIINQDAAYDLMGDSKWEDIHKYTEIENMYAGEIGRIHGVRFVETTEAKIFYAEDLVATGGANDARTLTCAAGYSTKVVTIDEALSTADAAALVGRYVIIDGEKHLIASAASGVAGSATFTVTDTPSESPADGDIAYPGEAGAKGRTVYSTLILGADAYGTTEVAGGGLEFIVKQLGSAGSSDALNQRATSGWKATKVTELLVDAYLLRIENTTTFNDEEAN